MKPIRFPSRAATLCLVAALGATAPLLTHSARTAPKKQLEIWPGQRVLLLLPLSISSNWNSDPALGAAIVPLAQPELERALIRTGKFSLTLPYRFDPILRRSLAEKSLTQEAVSKLVSAPTLETARPVVDKLVFDQPVMTTEIKLEEVRVGGTAALPTVQIQASGRLFQQGLPDPVKSITVTSAPSGGKTPTDRLVLATNRAFDEIAAAFVAPPTAFELPTPIPPTPAPTTKPVAGTPAPGTSAAASSGTSTSGAAPTSGSPSGAAAPAKPASATTAPAKPVAPSNNLPSPQGAPFVPQLPAGQPPLGIAVGEPGGAR